MAKLSVAIQAGGESSRMGRDKGLLPFGGVSLVEFILAQVNHFSEEIYINSNQPEYYKFLGLPVYSDIYHGVGALGGMHTILSYLQTDYVLALACDMPFINQKLIKSMIEKCENYDIVIPVSGENRNKEPFRAIYSKNCLSRIEKAIVLGERKVVSFFEGLDVYYVDLDEIHQFDPEEVSFININTPEDYQRFMRQEKLTQGGCDDLK